MEDATQIAVLALQVWLGNYAKQGINSAIAEYVLAEFTPGNMQRLIAEPQVLTMVAIEQAHLVGLAQLMLGEAKSVCNTLRVAEIERLYVHENFCGNGLGGQILAQIEREAKTRKVDLLYLTAWVHNSRARNFYAKAGFIDIGVDYFEMDDERHENRVLVKIIY